MDKEAIAVGIDVSKHKGAIFGSARLSDFPSATSNCHVDSALLYHPLRARML